MRRRLRARERQQLQSQASELLIEAHALGRSERPLAASSQMVIETLLDVAVDPPVSRPCIAKREVVPPAFQVPIQLRNQSRQGLMALTMVSVMARSLSRSRCSAFFDGITFQ